MLFDKTYTICQHIVSVLMRMCTGKVEILNWNWKEEKIKNKKRLRLLTAVHTGYYPYMILKKMSHLTLERFVTQLIRYSLDGYSNKDGTISQCSRPKWWPDYLKFLIPIRKLKDHLKKKEWASTLRNVVAACSEFHKMNFFNKVMAPNYVYAEDNVVIRRHSRSHDGFWTYSYGTNNRAVLKRETKPYTEKQTFVDRCKNYELIGNLNPVVYLSDITKDIASLLESFKQPKVVLVDIVKYPVNIKPARRRLLPPKFRKQHKKLIKQLPHVRLCNLFEQPKDIHYNKEDFLNYFKLGKHCAISDTQLTHNKAALSRILRNNNIPISSDLGRYGLQASNIIKGQTQRKTQRFEWYLKEIPEVKSKHQYSVTYTQSNSVELSHNYVFPKRQQHQTRLSLRVYSQLRKCKPVCVRVERMDLNKITDKYKKNSLSN